MLTTKTKQSIAKGLILCTVAASGLAIGSLNDGIDNIAFARSLYVTTSSISLRSGRSFSRSSLGKIPSGKPVDVLKVYDGGAWAKIRYNGKTGYVHTGYLKLTKVENIGKTTKKANRRRTTSKSLRADGYHMYTSRTVNVRRSASKNTKRLGKATKGKDVLIISRKGDWYKVYVNGRYGYIHGAYLKDYAVGSSSSGSSVKATRSTSRKKTTSSVQGKSLRSDGYHMYTSRGVALRSSNTASSKKLGSLPQGSDLLIIDKKGDWYKVYVNKRYGYVHGAYLKDYKKTTTVKSSSGKSSGSKKKSSSVQGSSLRSDGYHMFAKRSASLKKGPGSRYASVGSVSQGQDFLIIDAKQGYYKVYYKGAYYWVKKSHLKDYSIKTTKSYTSSGRSGRKESGNLSGGVAKSTGGTKSAKINIGGLGSYSNQDIPVSGRIYGSASSVSIYLNGTYLNPARLNGKSFSYTIPSQVTKPGKNTLRVEAMVNGRRLYQTKTFTVRKRPTILIDTGHGGADPGAIGRLNGKPVYEADYNLKIAKFLRQELINRGFNVKMSRTGDTYVTNERRSNIANNNDVDLHFALHHNAASPSARGGLSIYPSMKYNASTQASFTESREISQRLQKAYRATGMVDRGAYRDIDISGHTLYIMRNSRMRTVLTEMGFITNSQDVRLIVSPSFQRSLAKEMAKEISNFFYQ